MKKKSVSVAGLALLMLAGSCKKQTSPDVAHQNQSTSKMNAMCGGLNQFTYYDYGTDITEDDFVKNINDEADEKFNEVNHAMTLGLLKIYENNPEVMAALVADINGSKNKELNLYAVADKYPEIEDAMSQSFNDRFGDHNWRGYVATHYVYDVAYVPLIGFMNLGTVDASLPAYVSEPLELNEEKFAQFDDDYPMWIYNGTQMRFTSVNEEKGYYLTNPIVRIANGFNGDDTEEYQKIPSRFEEAGRDISLATVPKERPAGAGGTGPVNPGQVGPQYPQTDEWLTHVKFQVNERYENWGKSEYQFVWAQASAFNIVNFTWPEYSTHIRSIEKNLQKSEIGTMIPFYFDVFHSGNYASAYNFLKFRIAYMPSNKYCYYAVGAFERDWGNSGKHLFTICTYNGTVKGPRKYLSEWYFLDEATNSSYPFNTRNPNFHTSYWNNVKGVLQLHRWNL